MLSPFHPSAVNDGSSRADAGDGAALRAPRCGGGCCCCGGGVGVGVGRAGPVAPPGFSKGVGARGERVVGDVFVGGIAITSMRTGLGAAAAAAVAIAVRIFGVTPAGPGACGVAVASVDGWLVICAAPARLPGASRSTSLRRRSARFALASAERTILVVGVRAAGSVDGASRGV